MRHGPPVHEEEQEESAFVSMTDMMVGFLFIVMLVMVFFAIQFREENVVDRRLYEDLMTRHVELRKRYEALHERIARLEETIAALQARIASLENVRKENARLRSEKARLQKRVTALKDRVQALEQRLLELIRRLKTRDPLEEYLARAIQLRRQLVEDMRRRIKSLYPDLQVEVSPEGDALRFQGEGLFELGSAALRPRARRIIRDLARTLDKSLVCHTRNALATSRRCPDRGDALIEAVQVEGHTDTVGPPEVNLELSTRRALTAFGEMLRTVSRLAIYRNQRNQPVMAVAGYGEMRLAVPTADNVNEPRNRRIDLRIMLYMPSTRQELEALVKRLKQDTGTTSAAVSIDRRKQRHAPAKTGGR